jgi:hypothetical protein
VSKDFAISYILSHIQAARKQPNLKFSRCPISEETLAEPNKRVRAESYENA